MRITLFLFAPLLAAQTLPSTVEIDAAAVNANGFIYVTGTVPFGDLTATAGVFQPSMSDPGSCAGVPCRVGFVGMVSPPSKIVWASYLGMTSPTAISVAPNQNVYVAGMGVGSLPPLMGYQSQSASIFAVEISADGKSLLAGTWFGGKGDVVHVLRTDAAGSVYLAGSATSAQFPTTPGAYQTAPTTTMPPAFTWNICVSPGDGFVAKFDGTLKQLLFSTLVSSGARDDVTGLALLPDGSIDVLAVSGFAHTPGCFATSILRLKPDATAVLSSTYVTDISFEGTALAAAETGFVYAAGDNRQFSPPFRGMVLKIDSQGNIQGRQNIPGSITGLTTVGSDVIAVGTAAPGQLTPTSDAPNVCLQPDPSGFSRADYLVRMDAASLQIAYEGYWPLGIPLLDRGQVLNLGGGTGLINTVPAGPPPPDTMTCVADGATYTRDAISPGEVLSVFGVEIGPPAPLTAELDAAGNVSSLLGGIQVFIDAMPAPLLYVSPRQINLVAPFGLSPGHIASVELRRSGAAVGHFPIQVTSLHPGLFALNDSSARPLAALNEDGSVNGSSNPASTNSTVALFGTGFGAMTPLPIDGSRPDQIANQPVAYFAAYVNGVQVPIDYIGNAPGLVEGVVQINVALPGTLSSGTAAIRVTTTTAQGYPLSATGTIMVK